MKIKKFLNLIQLLCGAVIFPFATANAQSFPQTPFNLSTEAIWKSIVNFPSDLVSVEKIGYADDGSILRAIKVSDNPKIDEDEPKFLFTGIIHGKEVLGLRSVLSLVETLVNSYGTNTAIRDIVDRYEIWVIPVLNPVGYGYRSSVSTDLNLDGIPDYDINRDGSIDDDNDVDSDGMLDGEYRNGLRKNGINTMFWQTTGVDLASNYDFRFNRCNHPQGFDCNRPTFNKYRGRYAESEPETQAMTKLVKRLKPIFGITFHAGEGDRRGKVIYPYRVPRNTNIIVQETPERDQARYIAQYVLAPAILDNRRSGGRLCTRNTDVNNPCRPHSSDDPFYGAYDTNSTKGNWSNAATGMIDFLIETHSTYDRDGAAKYPSYRENHLYETSPRRNRKETKEYLDALEYARNYSDGMLGLLKYSSCLTPSGTPGVKGPGITGRIVDSQNNPLQATVRIIELDEPLIAGASHLHADYTDNNTDGIPEDPVMCTGIDAPFGLRFGIPCDAANQISPLTPSANPLAGTDFLERQADIHGRYNRLMPTGEFFTRRQPNGTTVRITPPSTYTISVSMPGYYPRSISIAIDRINGRTSCLTEVQDIVLHSNRLYIEPFQYLK